MLRKIFIYFLLLLPPIFSIFIHDRLWNGAIIAAVTITLWFTELIPLAVTGMLVPVFMTLAGVLSAQEAFSPFGNQILFLFIGSFLLGKAVTKVHLDRWFAHKMFSFQYVRQSGDHLVIAVSLSSWFLSMWISNTAATAMLVPLCLGLFPSNDSKTSSSTVNLIKRLLLSISMGTTVGGIATPIGTPPNALAISYLSNSGLQISFFDWVIKVLPLSVSMLFMLYWLLKTMFPCNNDELSSEINIPKSDQPLDRSQKLVLGCFCLAVLLWVLPGLLTVSMPAVQAFSTINERIPMGVAAVFAAGFLFILPTQDSTPVLSWLDAKNIDWGTIMLFGGGLCLGNMLQETGLADLGSKAILSISSGYTLTFVALMLVTAVILSEFSSNTASAAILLPIIIAAMPEGGQDIYGIIAVSLAASCGFMLPVSTPPNTIIYGTEQIKLKDMIKSGIGFDLLSIILIFIWFTLVRITI